jgi:hypothetical protein
MSGRHQTTATPTGLNAIVALTGIILVAYGGHFVLGRGAVIVGLACIAAGLLLKVATDAFGYGRRVRRGTGLENPFRVLIDSLREVRTRVRSWDERREGHGR